MRCCRLLMGQAACCCVEQSCEPPFSVLEVLGKARVAELVDALDLESSGSSVGVQFPPLAPAISRCHQRVFPSARSRVKLPAACPCSMSQRLPSSLLAFYLLHFVVVPTVRTVPACFVMPRLRQDESVSGGGDTLLPTPDRPFFAAPELRMRRACVALLFMVAETVPIAESRKAGEPPAWQMGEKIAQGAPCGIHH